MITNGLLCAHMNSLNLDSKPGRRSIAALVALVRTLNSKCSIAVLDVKKAGNCGREMLESIVVFVNRTPGVVVVLAMGQSLTRCHDRWPIAAAQLRRRTHLTIEFGR